MGRGHHQPPEWVARVLPGGDQPHDQGRQPDGQGPPQVKIPAPPGVMAHLHQRTLPNQANRRYADRQNASGCLTLHERDRLREPSGPQPNIGPLSTVWVMTANPGGWSTWRIDATTVPGGAKSDKIAIFLLTCQEHARFSIMKSNITPCAVSRNCRKARSHALGGPQDFL